MKQQFRSIVQIASALAENRLPTEIAAAIAKKRLIFGIAELVELLSSAKEVRTEAEKPQRKSTILMEVKGEILKAFPDLAQPLADGPNAPGG